MELKKKYILPRIECIALDSEISLALESATPPLGPDEIASNATPDYFNNNPYKAGLG
jgi:hypothetical protein